MGTGLGRPWRCDEAWEKSELSAEEVARGRRPRRALMDPLRATNPLWIPSRQRLDRVWVIVLGLKTLKNELLDPEIRGGGGGGKEASLKQGSGCEILGEIVENQPKIPNRFQCLDQNLCTPGCLDPKPVSLNSPFQGLSEYV